MNRRCAVISGGEFDTVDIIKESDFVIACDKGYEWAKRLGIRPDLVIADFDSYRGQVEEGIPVKKYPCEKDDTDTMAAVKYACENGFDEVVLFCAMGGRADHAFANYQSCAYAVERGLKAYIYGAKNRILFLKDSEITLNKNDNFSLSVFAFSDVCEGVTIRGAKYEIEDARLTNTFPLGASNEWKGDKATIRVRSGILMIVESAYA